MKKSNSQRSKLLPHNKKKIKEKRFKRFKRKS